MNNEQKQMINKMGTIEKLSLDLSKRNLSAVPDYIKSMKSLQRLYLS